MTMTPDPRPLEREPSASASDDHDPLRDELVGLRPHDHVEAERLESALAERLFGIAAAPTRIGRFDIHGRLGSGGVGVVYSAYDPQLDRHVALKLLRDSSRVGRADRQRLLREAHALARIKHPNVVTVHEVGQLGDQVFLVMEFVEGQNLHAWAHAADRGWRAVLDVYLQAGRGLAAAHAAGLVHRDFKPHNAIIGADGRVRVVDFGLARGEPAPEADETSPGGPAGSGSSPTLVERFDAVLTRPDALLGTPAYMSPEQCARRAVGPASDQWSFCVALHEALVGARPFDGRTPEELAARIMAGVPSEPPRGARVPAWLLATLRRGLRVAPEDRYPSMEALLEALARDPARARRRWLLGATLTALGGAVVVLALREPVSSPAALPCSGSAEALAGTWSLTRRAELGAHLEGLAEPRVAGSLLAALDGYAARWQAEHEHACLAHHRGEETDAMFDKGVACFAQRRAALDGVIQGLGTSTATTLQDAMPAVYDLAPVEACRDLVLLAAEPLPEEPAVRRSVEQAREQLARAVALADAGQPDQAHALAVHEEQRARELEYPPLAAEALLALGRIEMGSDRGDASRPADTLDEARLAGLRAGDLALAAEAELRRLFVEAIRPGGRPLADELETVSAMIESVPPQADVHGLYLANMGALAAARGDFPEAREWLARALVARRSVPEPRRAEVLETRFAVAVMSDDAEAQRAELEAVAEESEALLGPTHRRTLRARMILARTEHDPRAALREHATLCETYRRHPPHELADCLYDQGLRHAEAHELEAAAEVLERAAELVGAPTPTAPDVQRVRHARARSQALACRGRHAEVVTELRAVLGGLGDDRPIWLRAWVAELEVVLGEALVAEGRPVEAIDVLAPAARNLADLAALRFDADVERTLVRARLALARAHLDAVADDPIVPPATAATVTELLAAVEPRLEAAGPAVAWRLDELRALRRRPTAPPR